MKTGRPKKQTIVLRPLERKQLQSFACLRAVPHGLLRRAGIVLISTDSTQKRAKVHAWLAKRPRFHLPFTPIHALWLNQVERWFGLIIRQAIRRSSFKTVTDLVAHSDRYLTSYNQHSRPFKWTATADSFLAKVQRLSSKLSCGTPQ